MKNRFILAVLIPLFLIVVVSSVYASGHFPVISIACEHKSGILYAFDDGFSIKKNCEGDSRRVILIGGSGENGDKGDSGGDGNTAFPKPNFESEWIEFAGKPNVIDVGHNVGGSIEDYFIDVTYRRPNGSYMSHQTAANSVWWEDVEPNNIQIVRNGDVSNLFDAFRVRIWKIE